MGTEALSSDASEAGFAAYVDGLAQVLGHADRVEPFRDYCMGLLLPGERKSVEPIAAVVAPGRTAAKHQSLLNFVGESPWSDQTLLAKVRELVLPAIEAEGKIEAWIVDDTGFVKKGVHSVGVARQYCGRLGKTDNCQVAVSLSIANHSASLPVAYRLYLPEDWANDETRREKARVPDEVEFQTKPEIALAQLEAAIDARVPRGVVLADAGYGSDGAFRAGVTTLGLLYCVGVQSTISLWPPGLEPLPPEPWSGRGRKPSRLRRDADHQPVSAKTLAMGLPPEAWRNVSWREGSNATLSSRFAAIRVRPASGDEKLSIPRPFEWFLVEWPEGEDAPTKYWLSTLPGDTSIEVLVDTTKLRWRIERDYEELKSELGLAHFEGRGWRGFHHHATLCIAAYGFLIRERAALPPSGPRRRKEPPVSHRPRPRGAPDQTRATRPELDRDRAKTIDRRAGEIAIPMSMLPFGPSDTNLPSEVVTQ
jgi:SRSO17 transposase